MSTLRRAVLCFAALLAISHFVAAQMSPTQKLAEQRRQQQQAAYKAQQDARKVATRRLPAPCVVPDSYYPLRTCKISSSPQECGRGFNAWPNFNECCRPGQGGAFPKGCTDFNKAVECWIPGKYIADVITYIIYLKLLDAKNDYVMQRDALWCTVTLLHFCQGGKKLTFYFLALLSTILLRKL